MCNKGFRALQYVQLIGIPSKKEAGEEEEGSASHLLLPSAPLLFFWHHFHAIDLVQKSLQFATLAMIFWSQKAALRIFALRKFLVPFSGIQSTHKIKIAQARGEKLC
jgi:hypothetical protein